MEEGVPPLTVSVGQGGARDQLMDLGAAQCRAYGTLSGGMAATQGGARDQRVTRVIGMGDGLRSTPAHQYQVGERVEYSSTSAGKWIPAVVLQKHDDGTITLDCREHASPMNLRPLTAPNGVGPTETPQPIPELAAAARVSLEKWNAAAAARAAPHWILAAAQCMLCDGPFRSTPVSSGEHHCRYCGWVICSDCWTSDDGEKLMLAVDRWIHSDQKLFSKGDDHRIIQLQGGETKEKNVCKLCFRPECATREMEQRRHRVDVNAALIQHAIADVNRMHAEVQRAKDAAKERVSKSQAETQRAKDDAATRVQREKAKAELAESKARRAEQVAREEQELKFGTVLQQQQEALLQAATEALEQNREPPFGGAGLQLTVDGKQGEYVEFKVGGRGRKKHTIKFRGPLYQVQAKEGVIVRTKASVDSQHTVPTADGMGMVAHKLPKGSVITVLDEVELLDGTECLHCEHGWVTARTCLASKDKMLVKQIEPQTRTVALTAGNWRIDRVTPHEESYWEFQQPDGEWQRYDAGSSEQLEVEYQRMQQCGASFPPVQINIGAGISHIVDIGTRTVSDVLMSPATGPEPEPEGDLDSARPKVRRMVTVAANARLERLKSREYPQYWGTPIPTDEDFEFEDLSDDKAVMPLLRLCLQPDDPEQLGIGADASGWGGIKQGEVKHMKLHKAWRVHNQGLWQQYVAQIKRVAKDLTHVPAHRRQPIRLRANLDRVTSQLPGRLRDDVNEQYLMSGLPKETVLKVLTSGMNERFSGANAGTMHGEGVYFAEDAAKCDQYTRDADDGSSADLQSLHKSLYPTGQDVPSQRKPVQYIFICRVVLGATVITTNTGGQSHDRKADPENSIKGNGNLFATRRQKELGYIADVSRDIPYHSLLATLRLMRFREIITFNGARVYPEYLLAYRRCGISPQQAQEKQSKLMTAVKSGWVAAACKQAAAAPGGILLEGHPSATHNGVYQPQGTHEGWPYFANQAGIHLLPSFQAKHPAGERWLLSKDFTPDKKADFAYVVSSGGKIPTGKQTWKVWIDQTLHGNLPPAWVDHTLTVDLVIK